MMILTELKVSLIKLVIEELNKRAELDSSAFICPTINRILNGEPFYANIHKQEVREGLVEIKDFIIGGIGGFFTFESWLAAKNDSFVDNASVPLNVRLWGRVCWLERLCYLHERECYSVYDDGVIFRYTSFN